MGNVFDAILLLVLIAVTLVCIKLGFVRLLRPFRKIAAFVLAWSFKDSAFVQATVGKIIKTDKFKAFLNERVDALWGEKIENAVTAEGITIAERFDEVFGFWGKLFANIKNFCISLYDKNFAASPDTPPSEQVEAFVKSVTEYIGNAASHFFTALFGFVLLYILFSVGLWLGSKLLEKIFDEGVLGVVNKVVGGAVGVCYGFLLAWVLSIIFVLLFPLITTFDLATITGGYFGITEWFYSNFFISLLLGMTI